MRARWTLSTSLLFLTATAAFAEDRDEAKAKEQFKAAQAAYNLGQFDKALEGYSAAYAAKPLPPFLFNIAQCHKQLGQWERAGFFYRRFKALAPPGTDLQKLDELIARMDQRQIELEQAKDSAEAQRRAVELERAREAVAKAEAEAAAQRAAEAAAAARLNESLKPAQVPLYQRWWLWAGVGAFAAVGAAVTSVAIVTRPRAEVPSYGTVNAR